MGHAHGEDRYAAHRDALRRHVCAVCLDGAEDGRCGLGEGPRCPIEEHLGTLVDLVIELRSRRDNRLSAAAESRICSQCQRHDASGRCRSRDDGRCALSVFLPLIAEAIDEVERGPRDSRA